MNFFRTRCNFRSPWYPDQVRNTTQLSPRGWVKVPTGGDGEVGRATCGTSPKPANARQPVGRRPGVIPGPTVRVRMGEGFDTVVGGRARARERSSRCCRRRAPGPTRKGAMRDDEAMEQALAAGAAARRRRRAQSLGRMRDRPRRRGDRRGRDASRRAVRTPKSAHSRKPVIDRPRRHRLRDPRAVFAPRPHAPLRRRPDRRRRDARRGRARRPRSASRRRRASHACAPRAST